MDRRFTLPLLLLVATATAALSAPRSFAYVLQAERLGNGQRSVAIETLAQSGRDWIILDASFSGDDSGHWTPEELQALRTARPGRKIFSYLSIGEAENYRSYWKKSWSQKPPPFLGRENPDWPGNFTVHYWHPDWQRLILASLDSILAQGFDGIYLDIVDAFERFEYDPETDDWRSNLKNPATGNTYRQDMVKWITTLAAHARSKKPGLLIVPQNGSQLSAHPDYLRTIDAQSIEDLFTLGNRMQTRSHTTEVRAFLAPIQKAGKPILTIEYARKEPFIEKAFAAARQAGTIPLVTNRDLSILGSSLPEKPIPSEK